MLGWEKEMTDSLGLLARKGRFLFHLLIHSCMRLFALVADEGLLPPCNKTSKLAKSEPDRSNRNKR